MAVDTPAKIAVLGAGPIGLEAALYARFLGYEVVVFERGQVCQQVRSWRHVRMFTPAVMNRSLLGVAAIQAHDETYRPPADDAFLTGAEWVAQYLEPLSQTDLLADHLRLGTEVLAVGKEELLKHELPGDEDRGDWSFRILVREPTGQERIELADAVIDATGVLSSPNWIGHGGMPAVGEIEVKQQITHGFPDFLGSDRQRYAGRHTLLIGDDWTAVISAAGLATIARETPSTRVTWIVRGESGTEGKGPIRPQDGDPLSQRVQAIDAANAWANSGGESILFWPRTVVEAIRKENVAAPFEVELSGEHPGLFAFDEVVAHVGFRPQRSLYAELQVRECVASERSLKAAADPSLTRSQSLLQPEPNFYILGAKSFGRDPGFTFSEGLDQIRQLFTIIGDRESLDLYSGARSLVK